MESIIYLFNFIMYKFREYDEINEIRRKLCYKINAC